MLLQRHRTLLASTARLTAIATALLLLTLLIVTRSNAAFSDVTDNPSNSFSTGSVAISDDAGGTAMFSTSGMTPGNPVVNCISLTYSGSTPASIRMYGASIGDLAQYLDVTVDVGSGGQFGNCTGFVASSTIFDDALTNLPSAWATGVPTFTAATSPTVRTVRITVEVQNLPAAQNKSATATFTWEAQS